MIRALACVPRSDFARSVDCTSVSFGPAAGGDHAICGHLRPTATWPWGTALAAGAPRIPAFFDSAVARITRARPKSKPAFNRLPNAKSAQTGRGALQRFRIRLDWGGVDAGSPQQGTLQVNQVQPMRPHRQSCACGSRIRRLGTPVGLIHFASTRRHAGRLPRQSRDRAIPMARPPLQAHQHYAALLLRPNLK